MYTFITTMAKNEISFATPTSKLCSQGKYRPKIEKEILYAHYIITCLKKFNIYYKKVHEASRWLFQKLLNIQHQAINCQKTLSSKTKFHRKNWNILMGFDKIFKGYSFGINNRVIILKVGIQRCFDKNCLVESIVKSI